MMMAATRAQMSREAKPAVNTASMATARKRAGINNFRRGGAESSTSDNNVKARELFALAAMNAGPASSNKTSPACNLIFPGCWWTRLPSRWTAMTAAPYRVRNRTSLTVLPTKGPFLAMTALVKFNESGHETISLNWQTIYSRSKQQKSQLPLPGQDDAHEHSR